VLAFQIGSVLTRFIRYPVYTGQTHPVPGR
jgi:hypothetical protein